jgi:hypothetical protein
MLDLFGQEVILTKACSSRGTPRGGYAARPGTGPAGERCGTCIYDTRIKYHGKYYHKCELCRDNWTHGTGSDIKQKTPACVAWKPKTTNA